MLHKESGKSIEAQKYAESIIKTIHVPLVLLDIDLNVIMANPSFFQAFKITPGTEKRLLNELGNQELEGIKVREMMHKMIHKTKKLEDYKVGTIPKLQNLLEQIISTETTISDLEVEYEFSNLGKKNN